MMVTGTTLPSSLSTSVLIRIDTSKGDVALPRGAEVVGGSPGEYIDLILPQLLLADLAAAHYSYTVLIDDIDQYDRAFAGQYHTFAEIEQILQTTATNYPGITHLTSIGKSYQNRDLWCLEISDNPGVDEEEPGVFFMGLHHAREWPTVEICLTIINRLTSQYASNTTIQQIVNNRRIWIVPCMNPDGYYYCHDQSHDWRKNRHFFPQYGSTGVDLNRNYAGSSDGTALGSWGTAGNSAATHNPWQEVYCGPGPLSENETNAIAQMFLTNDICASITWHTYSELVMWPWGYATNARAPDATYLTSVGQGIASRITQQDGTGTYNPRQSSYLYPTTGDTTDWAYGYSHYVLGKNTFAYTIEACQDFHPPAGALDQICNENFEGAFYLLEEAETINELTPRVLPPAINNIPDDPDGDYTISWEEQNPLAHPDMFQLDELTGFTTVTDDAEQATTLWNLDGFSLSTTRAHSGISSYQAHQVNNKVSSMATTFPLPVTEGMKLGFWCWYKTENNYDVGFAEVSTNGRTYDLLGSFTGTSSDWQYKEYDLSAYANQSIFIRFRYTTDDETTLEGFYVDDITPVPSFALVTNLSAMVTDHSFPITGKNDGTYYYQVRGHNLERGWGDLSMPARVIVGTGVDNQPPTLEILSPQEHSLYLNNKRILPFFITLLIGTTTITVNTSDESGIKHVSFYLDDELKTIDIQAPYNWTWDTAAFFRHTITIVSEDSYGNPTSADRVVWKLF